MGPAPTSTTVSSAGGGCASRAARRPAARATPPRRTATPPACGTDSCARPVPGGGRTRRSADDELLGHLRTQILLLARAVVTGAAWRRRRRHHRLALAHAAHLWADLHHVAGELVPEQRRRREDRMAAHECLHVSAAGQRRAHADHDPVGSGTRQRQLAQLDVAGAHENVAAHRRATAADRQALEPVGPLLSRRHGVALSSACVPASRSARDGRPPARDLTRCRPSWRPPSPGARQCRSTPRSRS